MELTRCCHCNSGLGFDSPANQVLNDQLTMLLVPFGGVSQHLVDNRWQKDHLWIEIDRRQPAC